MPDKRDANEVQIVQLWRHAGCVWIPQPRSSGFDGVLICPRTGIHLVEVKNDARRWQLTAAERARCLEVESVGAVYSIVRNEREAMELVGMQIEESSEISPTVTRGRVNGK